MYGKEIEPHLGGYIVGVSDFGDPNTYATEVWDYMISKNIKSVIDVGCGQGHSLKYFLDKGIKAIGVEGGTNAIESSPVKEFIVKHDYTKSSFTTSEEFDAIWCCEFVEHIEEKYIDNFLATFMCAKNIFMTHAVPNQEGYHHVNCQTSDYWIDKVENMGAGFKCDLSLSIFLRKLTNKMHVSNTLLFFSR